MSNSTFTSMNNDTTDWPMQRTKSFEDSYYEDPNYSAYNHLPESFSQANQTQIVEESFVNARSVYNDNNGIAANYMQDEHMMAYSPQGGYSSQEGRYDIDELDELILDDADVEAEVNNPLSEPFKSVRPTVAPSHDRPFTPIHELGNFWPANDQAMGLRGGFNVIEPFNDGVVYGMHEDGNEQIHEFEFDDVLGTISEFDPNRNAMY